MNGIAVCCGVLLVCSVAHGQSRPWSDQERHEHLWKADGGYRKAVVAHRIGIAWLVGGSVGGTLAMAVYAAGTLGGQRQESNTPLVVGSVLLSTTVLIGIPLALGGALQKKRALERCERCPAVAIDVQRDAGGARLAWRF